MKEWSRTDTPMAYGNVARRRGIQELRDWFDRHELPLEQRRKAVLEVCPFGLADELGKTIKDAEASGALICLVSRPRYADELIAALGQPKSGACLCLVEYTEHNDSGGGITGEPEMVFTLTPCN